MKEHSLPVSPEVLSGAPRAVFAVDLDGGAGGRPGKQPEASGGGQSQSVLLILKATCCLGGRDAMLSETMSLASHLLLV